MDDAGLDLIEEERQKKKKNNVSTSRDDVYMPARQYISTVVIVIQKAVMG